MGSFCVKYICGVIWGFFVVVMEVLLSSFMGVNQYVELFVGFPLVHFCGVDGYLCFLCLRKKNLNLQRILMSLFVPN